MKIFFAVFAAIICAAIVIGGYNQIQTWENDASRAGTELRPKERDHARFQESLKGKEWVSEK